MVDLVSSQILSNGTRMFIVNIKNTSDGTGESNILKIDKSTLTGPNGAEPSKLCIERITGQCNGMVARLSYDRDTDIVCAVIDGGYVDIDYSKAGGFRDTGTGGSGDLLLTTAGATANDSYDLTIYCRLVD